ncbi:hypothetical protein BOX15_Mlig021984g1 [Macrostomum lignano]|uniref:Protein-tyrosine-phosphatase n=1 Tax=Macrostomum lignano TaxID=282301 RepID=A0A267EMI2_9PLAT|nr:hypothetical protein BOX15_Mlig021984g1 [Macrostomum lignano]
MPQHWSCTSWTLSIQICALGLLLLLGRSATLVIQDIPDSSSDKDPVSPVFSQQPPAQFLVSSTTSDTIVSCRAQSTKPPTSSGSSISTSGTPVNIRWRFEKLEYNLHDGGKPRVVDSDYVGAGDTSSMFNDRGDGSVAILAAAEDADFLAASSRLPKYRLFCEAAVAGPDGRETVVHSSKMLVKKVTNLRYVQAQTLCHSAPRGGVVICKTQTSPDLTDYFNVTHYRFNSTDRTATQLNYSFFQTKYAIFENGYNSLHILHVDEKDVKFRYSAEVSLTEGAKTVFTAKSMPTPIQLLPTSSSFEKPTTVRTVRTAHEIRSGLVVLLPCYLKGAGGELGAGRKYSWRKNGLPLRVSEIPYSEQTFAFVREDVGSLRIRDPRRSDAGVYTCSFGDTLLENVTLDLYSRISVRTPASPLIVDFGGNVSLACDVQGWPIDSISWLHNGRPVEVDGTRIRVTRARESLERGHSVLTIANATLKDQGPYQCFAERFLRPSAQKVPYDSAQSTTEVIINKMPPHLVDQQPPERYIPVSLPGTDGGPVSASGSFSCRFTAAPLPRIRITLDGSRSKFDEFESLSARAFTRQTSASTRRMDVTVNFSPTLPEHTGRLMVEARNDFGVATCEFHLFAVASPSLIIRPFEQKTQYAIRDKNFSMDCNVLGGLHSGVDLAVLSSRYPGLRVTTYDLRWEMRSEGGAVLKLPTNHRTSVDDAEHPDRLRITDVESIDAGQYTCTATVKQSGVAGSSLGPSASPSQSTKLEVVNGIRPNTFSDQLDLESGIKISDVCKPVNTPDGPWYAWWEFVSSRNGSQRILEPCLMDMYSPCSQRLVTYQTISSGIDSSDCPISNRFVEARVPQFLLSDPSKRNTEAKIDIGYTDDKPFEGVFICHLVSCHDAASSAKRVKYKKEYIFKPGHPPNNKEVVLGTSVSVGCQLTEAGPDMPGLLWYSGSKLIRERQVPRYNSLNGTSARVFQFDNGTLRIAEIRPEDRHFLCATDLPDTSKLRSTTFNPSIRYPAQVLPFESSRLELHVGSNHSIPCVVKGDKPYNVSWVARYEGDNNIACLLMPSDRPHYSSYGYQTSRCSPGFVYDHNDPTTSMYRPPATIAVTEAGVLELKNVNRGVHGRYICRARNRYNSQRDASADQWPSEQQLDVVVIQRPGQVQNFVTTDHDQNSATLQWEAPASNGHKEIVRYAIAYLEPTGRLAVQNLSVDQKSYTFKGLQPGTEYIFNITAVNSVGPGPEASCRVVTKERAPSGPVQDLTVIAEGASALRLTWQPPELLKRNGRMTNYSVTVWPVSATAGANDCELAGSDAKVQFRCSGTAAFIGPRSDSRPGGGAAGSLGPAICFSEHNPLKAFTEYQVRLTPLNAVGAGPPNCVRVRTLESTPRSPPASPRCEAKSNSQILVSWRAPDPSSVNGIAKDYQIQYMPAQDAIEQNETLAKEETSEGSEHLVSGLQMYTNYSFTVTVANSKGRSAPTSRIFCRTQSAPPDPPLDVRAYGVNATHAVLAWRQTEAPNGRLKGYKIKYTCSDKTASEIDHPLPAGGPVSHYEHQLIGGLSVNAQCEFSVAAENDNFLGRYSRRELLFVSETPRLQVVSFRQDFLVTQSARLVLDCYIVGHGNTSPRWTMPTVDSPRTERLPNGSLVITGLRNIGGPHRYKCSDTDDTSSVTYNVQVATVQNLPVPQTPRLLPGQRTNSSLEVIWRPMGIGSRDSASIPVAAGDSLIAGYNLNYVNLYSAAEDTRTVSARNRSYLVDPVQCGAAMKFRIRAVNGFDLKSPYTEYMEMRTLGSRPVLRSGAGPIAQILTNRIGIEFNFTDILPGDGCHAYKYLVYLNSLPLENGFERGILQPTAVATRDSLENGCCLKVLDSNLLTGLARRGVSAEGRLLHFAVVAHNAAGNLTIQSSLKLTGLLLRGIDGRGEVGHAGTSGAKESSRSQPNLPNGMPSSGGISGWQNWPYILAAGVLALLLVCLFAVCTTVLYRQHKQHSPGIPVDQLQQQPPHHLLPPHQQHLLLQQQQQYRSNYHQQYQQQQHLLLQHEKGIRAPQVLVGKPPAAVPYEDDEDDRESVDSKGNIRAYATFDADGATKPVRNGPGAGGGGGGGSKQPKQILQQQQLPPYENESSTLAGGGPYAKGGPQLQPSGHHQHPALGLGVRASHMSSATTLSSNHEELVDAYRTQQLLQQLAPMHHPLPAHTAEYEENSGSSETTDPGIRNFTNLPPNPNELRNATCEVPLYQQDDPRSRQPQPPMLGRHRRQPSMAESEQTYESIDDVMQRSLTLTGGLMPKSRNGTLPSVPQQQQQQQQQFRRSFNNNNNNNNNNNGRQQPQQQRRVPPSEADSYGTGVYEATDSAYNYGTQPGPRHRLAGGGAGGSSIYNSYRPSQRLYWPERQQQPAAAMPATREDVEDEVQQLLGGNRLPADAPAGPQQQRAADADDGRDSADSTEDDPTYDTRNVTFV